MTDTRNYWVDKLAKYAQDEWADQPSLFAQQALDYFPSDGSLLELGSGLGNDSKWFAAKGYQVIATDQLELSGLEGIDTQTVDLSQPLPFEPDSFDIIYSHLALHYFSLERTKTLFSEIYEILKPGGILAFLVNSVHDPEIGEVEEIEANFLKLDDIEKRYFDLDLTRQLTRRYKVLLLDDRGTSYKDQALGLANLIRFVGKKT